MLDIIDIRRQQVMMEGEFPAQLQTAFRGMERAKNPWGIGHEKRHGVGRRVAWCRRSEENPEPDVLVSGWGARRVMIRSRRRRRGRLCSCSTQAERELRGAGQAASAAPAIAARRAGNEYLYRQLADGNVATLNEVRPKLIVATCPHCMNTIGKEYKQIGGDFKVVHHTEYLESLVAEGKLEAESSPSLR